MFYSQLIAFALLSVRKSNLFDTKLQSQDFYRTLWGMEKLVLSEECKLFAFTLQQNGFQIKHLFLAFLSVFPTEHLVQWQTSFKHEIRATKILSAVIIKIRLFFLYYDACPICQTAETIAKSTWFGCIFMFSKVFDGKQISH